MTLKKRIIFTLLFKDNRFVLSRNFRLQAIGDFQWLEQNYNFSNVSFFIDELIVIDVSKQRDNKKFFKVISDLSSISFVPITAGGGISSLEQVKTLFDSGADKVILNTELHNKHNLLETISDKYGKQCLVGSIDISKREGVYKVFKNYGEDEIGILEEVIMNNTNLKYVGELYINSIDNDGTGNGLDLSIARTVRPLIGCPIILSGGIGNAAHIIEGLSSEYVDAVSTAHLLNFLGNGLEKSRDMISKGNINIATWENIRSFKRRVLSVKQ